MRESFVEIIDALLSDVIDVVFGVSLPRRRHELVWLHFILNDHLNKTVFVQLDALSVFRCLKNPRLHFS